MTVMNEGGKGDGEWLFAAAEKKMWPGSSERQESTILPFDPTSGETPVGRKGEAGARWSKGPGSQPVGRLWSGAAGALVVVPQCT